MLGYYNRPDSDAEAFDEEGYMRTGDVVHIDENGFLFVIDRVKEVNLKLNMLTVH
jgi:long-subunit acyl-CoA synthetase (AMP-forming)